MLRMSGSSKECGLQSPSRFVEVASPKEVVGLRAKDETIYSLVGRGREGCDLARKTRSLYEWEVTCDVLGLPPLLGIV